MGERLRAWTDTEQDVAFVADAFDDPEMNRQGEVAGSEDARAWLRERLEGPGQWAWCLEVDGEAAGAVRISQLSDLHRTGWVSYWIHRDRRGHGRAGRAAEAACTWALTDGNLFRLELGFRADNLASFQTALQAGFHREGVERLKFVRPDRDAPSFDPADRVDVWTCARLRTDPRPMPGGVELDWVPRPMPAPAV